MHPISDDSKKLNENLSPISFDNKINPVLITELSLNRSLFEDILEWNDTKKMISIYGIATAMSYLHSCSIIHSDLKLSNILINDYLFPIIVNFGLSTFLHYDKYFINCANERKKINETNAPLNYKKRNLTKSYL